MMRGILSVWVVFLTGLLSLGCWAWQDDWFYLRQSSMPEPRQPIVGSAPSLEKVRLAYREAVQEVWKFSLAGMGMTIASMVAIVFVLIYRPTRIPQAKPFDPERERRRPPADP